MGGGVAIGGVTIGFLEDPGFASLSLSLSFSFAASPAASFFAFCFAFHSSAIFFISSSVGLGGAGEVGGAGATIGEAKPGSVR